LTDQSGAQGEQLLYTLEVPAGATNLHFETSGNVANQDADLYVSLNGQPLCQSAGPADEEVCNIANPQPGTWLATVDAYTTLTNFTILGSFDTPVDLIFANGFD
jgi:vibriolysin